MRNDDNLIWLDLEMTGLDPARDRIIEIATLVTDSELNVLAEGPVFAIATPDTVLEAMDDWNREHHGKSGLIDRIRREGVPIEEAEARTLEFLHQYVPPGKSPMCGNSICQDRRFMVNYMPKLEAYFHYRNLDVSTLKELARRWAPPVFEGAQQLKRDIHLALEDIKDSIEELRYYRKHLFLPEFRGEGS
ncbi:oligoribonuclease [Sulfurivirga caldicuralii]|uniref:Oligoribonuclease n=1 Tax=Sulfurivirga caldicuralii TaxID=364032 RepID=A0A1N6G6D7_9GAMM|nr:oligoribonuclease [Sulfurivirga caldicuralii]SIO03067.1 oligoribonuclease [Sulfurivirga caldicuralii]